MFYHDYVTLVNVLKKTKKTNQETYMSFFKEMNDEMWKKHQKTAAEYNKKETICSPSPEESLTAEALKKIALAKKTAAASGGSIDPEEAKDTDLDQGVNKPGRK